LDKQTLAYRWLRQLPTASWDGGPRVLTARMDSIRWWSSDAIRFRFILIYFGEASRKRRSAAEGVVDEQHLTTILSLRVTDVVHGSVFGPARS